MHKLIERLKDEPALLVAAIQSLLLAAIGQGLLAADNPKVQWILLVCGVVGVMFGGGVVRSAVSPTRKIDADEALHSFWGQWSGEDAADDSTAG